MSQLNQAGPPEAPLHAGHDEVADRTVAIDPRVDVLETEDEFLILADMPGVKPDDVDVRFEKGELTLHGRRPAGPALEATAYHRSFAVADTLATDRITADLRAGVLTIHLPKVEAVKPKRIRVSG